MVLLTVHRNIEVSKLCSQAPKVVDNWEATHLQEFFVVHLLLFLEALVGIGKDEEGK